MVQGLAPQQLTCHPVIVEPRLSHTRQLHSRFHPARQTTQAARSSKKGKGGINENPQNDKISLRGPVIV